MQRQSLATTICLLLLLTSAALAQSGRGGRTTPPPTPPPAAPAANVPKTSVLNPPTGGKLLRAEMDGATTRYLLGNGLNVLLRERHSSPLVAVHVLVKAGTLHEPEEQAGMAQLVHRLVLQGAAKRPLGSLEKDIARLGGVLKTESLYDHTSLNVIAPAESLSSIVALLAELLMQPAFAASDFDTATYRKLVNAFLQEQQQVAERNPLAVNAFAFDRLLATAFSTHRLKRGLQLNAALSNAPREQVVAFWRTHYQPQNMLVAVVGDMFGLQAIANFQTTFGLMEKAAHAATTTTTATAPVPAAAQSSTARPTRPISAPPVPVTKSPATTAPAAAPVTSPAISPLEEAAQEKLRYGNTRADISQTVISIGYRVPTLARTPEALKEQAVLEVLAAALGTGRGARLAQMLPERSGLPTEAATVYQSFPGAGIFAVQLRADAGRIDRVEADYFRELERFKREMLSEGELQRAKVMLEKRYFDRLARLEEEAGALARYFATLGDYKPLDTLIPRTRAVTAAEIQQAAANYLTLANASLHEYEPQSATPRTFTADKFAELIATFAPAVLQPVKPGEAKPAVALKRFVQGEERGGVNEGRNILVAEMPLPLKDFSVLRGTRAYVREDRSLPKLTVGVFFAGGRLLEDANTNGLTELMLRAMMRSTTSRKGDLIALELESYGADLQIVNEADFFGYTVDVLSRNAEAAIKVLVDIVERPFFDKPELTRERDALLAEQLKQRDDAQARAIELMWQSLYPGGHPYALSRLGSAAAVRAVTPATLEAWHAKTIKRQFPLVMLVGDTDGSALVSRIFSEAFRRGELDKTMQVNLPPLTAPPAEQSETRTRPQTSQAIGFRTAPSVATSGRANDNTSEELVMQMWAALSATGRFPDALRAKLNLSVPVNVVPDLRLASGAFYAAVTTPVADEVKARESIEAEFARLLTDLPSDEEFERGRNFTIGAYAIALQDHPARTLEYARAVLRKNQPGDVENQPDQLRAIRRSDFKRVAELIIKPTQTGRGTVRGTQAGGNSTNVPATPPSAATNPPAKSP